MRIGLFGGLGDKIGREVELDAPLGCTIAELRARLADAYPDAAAGLAAARARACVDDAMVAENFVPRAGSEVAFLPPVSGG